LHAARFNWGLTVKSKAERVLKLLERGPFLEEERERARKIAREIKGFGSFNLSSVSRAVAQPSSGDCGSRGVGVVDSLYGRSNSKYEERWRREDDQDKENLIARPESRTVEAEEPHHRHPFHEFGRRSEAMLLLSQ
jgi:epsin